MTSIYMLFFCGFIVRCGASWLDLPRLHRKTPLDHIGMWFSKKKDKMLWRHPWIERISGKGICAGKMGEERPLASIKSASRREKKKSDNSPVKKGGDNEDLGLCFTWFAGKETGSWR